MQAAILGNVPALTGRYRAEQVWIGGRYGFHPHGVEFVPPHHDRVPAAMDDLLRFVARDAQP
ncbi:hypothetical protein C5B85_17045 [Pseudoclavibacter sp. AY1F1]|nr:hypothetical protein C5B85_17045 [Pseudoclavibacter sp. AY1F1]